jgi:hypothetical protein
MIGHSYGGHNSNNSKVRIFLNVNLFILDFEQLLISELLESLHKSE